MFQKELLGSSVNKQDRRRTVTVRFFREDTVFNEETKQNELKIVEDFNKDFFFSLDDSVEVMKARVHQYLDELNFVPPEITDLDYVDPTPPSPTASELAREQFIKDLNRLMRAKKMASLNVPILTPAQMTNLENKVKEDMKPEYEDLIPLN